jgi:hypothetical protein
VTSTIYLDTVKKVARASITGTAQPSVPAKLLAHLKLIIKFFGADGVIAVDADTPTCVIKPVLAPTGAPSLIDTTAVRTGTGATSQYVFEWASADSTTLRAVMDATGDPTQPVELRCEVEYELDGNLERIAFPILFETSYTRPEDPAPEANTDSSWEWLKLRAPVANGFSHDDVERELTVAGGAGSGDVVGPASSVDSRPALFNGATGKLLKQGTAALGDAAYKSTGTTAGTLAAGDDARMTNARTPTAHASTHLTGGADAIQAATSAQPGLATAAQITKLDGIEAGADVTDAGNVGTAISSADAVTTLADADKLPVTASGVLKTLAYSALKTLLNALYAIKGAITGSGLTMSTARLLGRSTASSGAIEEITLGSGLTLTAGTLSATGGGGSGDVVGPASAVTNRLPIFNGTTGKLIKDSGLVLTLGTAAVQEVYEINFEFQGFNGLFAANAHLLLYDENGSVCVWWYDSFNNNPQPSGSFDRFIQVNIDSSIHTTVEDLAAFAFNAINNDSEFNSTLSPSSLVITVTVVYAGVITNPSAVNLASTVIAIITNGADAGIPTIGALNGSLIQSVGLSNISGLGTNVATALAVNSGSSGSMVVNGGVLGTPSSGTLSSCTGLPIAGITASTSTALGVGSLNIGHASDTTLARSSAGNLTIEGNLIYRAGGSFVGMPFEYSTAVSDEATALTAGTAKLTFRMPCAMTVTSVRASVGTAPTGSTLIVDINENGTSILSTKLSIDATEKTSTTAATPAVLSDSALADDAEITIDIDQIGSTIAGAGLKVTIIGTRA